MRWLIVSVYAAGLIAVTLVPWSPGVGVSRIDVALHFAAWAVLSFLVTISLRGGSRAWFSAAVSAAIGAIGFGGVIEMLQPLTGRSADMLDLIADALGAIIGAAIGAAVMCRERQSAARQKGSE